MKAPKNQYQLVLYYLYNKDNFSLRDLINDSMFFKFQTRLSEIEKKINKSIATRERVRFTNRFGVKSSYNIYNAIDKNKIKELYEDYCN